MGLAGASQELLELSRLPESDHEYPSSRGFLALVGTGDFEALRAALLDDQPGRSSAYAYTLAGLQDDRGRAFLVELLDSPDTRLSSMARKALEKVPGWLRSSPPPHPVAWDGLPS